MRKCPTCHMEYTSSAGFQAHVPNCAYRDDPLPEPEVKTDELDNLKVDELKAMAEELGIEVNSKMKKAELIETIRGSEYG